MSDYGKWGEAGVPRKGWYSADTYDSCPDGEEPHLTCEMCERQTIRYVHRMRHDDYHQDLDCGCKCAEKMSEDYVSPKRRERDLRNAASRATRKCKAAHPAKRVDGDWVQGGSKWRKKGSFGKATVFASGDVFRVRLHEVGEAVRFGKRDHPSAEAAMTAVDKYLAEAG